MAGILCCASFETTLGETYSFPDMDSGELDKLANYFPEGHSSITLSNVSGACLVIPVRIIKAFYVDGVERWHRP